MGLTTAREEPKDSLLDRQVPCLLKYPQTDGGTPGGRPKGKGWELKGLAASITQVAKLASEEPTPEVFEFAASSSW